MILVIGNLAHFWWVFSMDSNVTLKGIHQTSKKISQGLDWLADLKRRADRLVNWQRANVSISASKGTRARLFVKIQRQRLFTSLAGLAACHAATPWCPYTQMWSHSANRRSDQVKSWRRRSSSRGTPFLSLSLPPLSAFFNDTLFNPFSFKKVFPLPMVFKFDGSAKMYIHQEHTRPFRCWYWR